MGYIGVKRVGCCEESNPSKQIHVSRARRWLQHTTTHCNTLYTLQHTAIPCNSLQYAAIRFNTRLLRRKQPQSTHQRPKSLEVGGGCNTLQHTATQSCCEGSNSSQYINDPRAKRWLQHTAKYCNTLQHTASNHTFCLRCLRGSHHSQHMNISRARRLLQHTATHCNTHIFCLRWL